MVPCDQEEYSDLVHHRIDRFVPVPGEYPLLVILPDIKGTFSRLSDESMSAFSSMSEDEYNSWWGIRSCPEKVREKDDVLVHVSTGLYHFCEIFGANEFDCLCTQESISYPLSRVFCSFPLIYSYSSLSIPCSSTSALWVSFEYECRYDLLFTALIRFSLCHRYGR